jgi:hypothetical protein
MGTVTVTVTRRSPREHLGRFGITTFPVDENGENIGRTSPKVSHWRVTWAPIDGSAHAHPPVYKNVRRQTLDFDTESQARETCKKAIKRFFDSQTPANIDVV